MLERDLFFATPWIRPWRLREKHPCFSRREKQTERSSRRLRHRTHQVALRQCPALRFFCDDLAALPKIDWRTVHAGYFAGRFFCEFESAADTGCEAFWFLWLLLRAVMDGAPPFSLAIKNYHT